MIDYHIHTDHSGDGKTPLLQQVESAVEKGLSEICITSHFDHQSPSKHAYTFEPDFDKYFSDIAECQARFKQNIRIKIGIEVGLQAEKPSVLTYSGEMIRKYPFDFVIASMHYLPGRDLHKPQQWIDEGVGKRDVQGMYLKHTIDNLNLYDDYDVIGHLTYFSRFVPANTKAEREMTYEDNAELYDRLFELLIERNKGFEINTSVLDTQELFMPDFSIAKRFYQMGGRIVTVGSDAHYPAQVGGHFKEAIRMLREAGFTAICTFDKRKPTFVNI